MKEKANNRTLIKNTGIIAIGNISTKMINFLLLPMYTALISTKDYGTIDLLSTYSTLLMAVVSLQLFQAAFRFVAVERENSDNIRHVLSTMFFLSFVAALIYTILFVASSPFIHMQQKWYLLFQVLANIYLMLITNSVRGIGDNTTYAFANFLSAAVTLILNVLFLVVFHWNAMTMLVAYIVGPIIGGTEAFIYSKLWRYISIKFIDFSKMKLYLQYAVPLVPNELSWWVVHASDRTIISATLGVAANGLIAVASKFSSIYTTVFSVFNTAWTEQCVLHFEEEGGKEYLSRTMVTVTRLFTSMTIGLIAVMPFVFPIMVNSKYQGAYGLIPVYLIAVYFNVLIGLISPIYLIHNETGKVAKSTFGAAVINIVVDILLVKFIGAYAAPVSSVAAYLVISFWRLWDIKKRYMKIPFTKVFVLNTLVTLIIVLVGYCAKKIVIQSICLLIAILYAVITNREILNSILQKLMNRKTIEK